MTGKEVHEIILDELKEIRSDLKAIHTPSTCEGIREIKNELAQVTKQQNRWLGGMAVLVGIGGLIVSFKDNLLDFFRK